ncbi:MAG: ABC transporter ATP-binding protein [Planctomycetota bacterium]|nr:MAG: ABC transporter ATP-binding protein [Planctomycetota bacterium]
MSAPVFQLENTSARYGKTEALRIDSLSLKPGRRYGIVGANGAGKTTLLYLLAGLRRPAEGSVLFEGKDLYGNAARLNAARRRVTCIFQIPVLFRGTVFSNIAYPLAVRGIPSAERARKVSRALELVELSGFEKRKSDSLSDGEKQKVMHARALVFDPDVLLVDEPVVNIDRAYRPVLMSILSGFAEKEGRLLVFTSHNASLVSRYADEVLALDSGRLVDSYPENIFMAEVVEAMEGKAAQLPGGFTVPLPVESTAGEKIKVVLSPEKIRIERTPETEKPSGTVWKIESAGSSIKLSIDVGVQLVVVLSADEYNSIKLLPGEKVSVTVPAEAVSME